MRVRERQLEIENERLYKSNEELKIRNQNLEREANRRDNFMFEDRMEERLDGIEKRFDAKIETIMSVINNRGNYVIPLVSTTDTTVTDTTCCGGQCNKGCE